MRIAQRDDMSQENLAQKTLMMGLGILSAALALSISIAIFDTPDYYMLTLIILFILGSTISIVIPTIIVVMEPVVEND